MLKFDNGNFCFNFRSVAVVIHDDYVLLHKAKGDPFWALPGGRVEFFENSDAAVRRELFEELGVDANVKRHLWYVENFFEHSGKKIHEIANYFLVQLAESDKFSKYETFRGVETEVELEFEWFSLNDIADISIKPEFLKKSLLNLPLETTCIKIDEVDA